ncbi:Gfo/Idh/MocA family oxidoreductase [Gordonia insulae]|uniref:Scyllo-inositol 2-dehydrogenase (NADP(+)) n=1 Tax=Gordonia insulae TaxID=2420509 RepID=A0A3G8JTR8_9ACTN|nr:Gfo/Idh/MocA family oxidoreductase [Gordonia insulae]AZG48467.1 scyllo-inositol 2-dehydrogenase (NADP(+)) [Gordonia insulae]
MRLGLVGYGAGGRLFHAPYIRAVPEIDLVGVVTRSPDRRRDVAADLPDVAVFDSLGDLLDAGVDAVTITTPPDTRRDLVLEAVRRGVHVVADKPFAPDAAGGRELAAAADGAGVLLSVFHNRRWDTDLETVRRILPRLGEVWRVESRFDLDEPGSLDAGPSGGLLRDLGAHMVDQVLTVFGPAVSVTAHLDQIDQPEGRTDCGFTVAIAHRDGVHSTVSASKINHVSARQWRIYGSAGAYVSDGTDVQTDQIKQGRRPADDLDNWGYERPDRLGTLHTADGVVAVPSAQGRYDEFYRQFAAAVDRQGPQPVPARDGIATLEVLDAARDSAIDGATVRL